MGGGGRGQQGDKMVAGRDLTLGGEHTIECAGDVLKSCTLETCMFLLTNVTPINSIKIDNVESIKIVCRIIKSINWSILKYII